MRCCLYYSKVFRDYSLFWGGLLKQIQERAVVDGGFYVFRDVHFKHNLVTSGWGKNWSFFL